MIMGIPTAFAVKKLTAPKEYPRIIRGIPADRRIFSEKMESA